MRDDGVRDEVARQEVEDNETRRTPNRNRGDLGEPGTHSLPTLDKTVVSHPRGRSHDLALEVETWRVSTLKVEEVLTLWRPHLELEPRPWCLALSDSSSQLYSLKQAAPIKRPDFNCGVDFRPNLSHEPRYKARPDSVNRNYSWPSML